MLASGLTLLALLVLPLERALHSVYWNGWELVGYEQAVDLGTIRDPTVASNVQSWYGPAGLAATLVAIGLVTRSARRGDMPRVAVLLAGAPLAFLAATAFAVVYFDFNGRFVMGGVALSAATWGVIHPVRAAATALVAVCTTTVLLALVNYSERPAGVDLLEGTDRPSIWTLPREWAQSIQPEVAVVIGFADHQVPPGAPIGLARSSYYPFAYAGYPRLQHRLVYVDSLDEATARGADWAVLPLTTECRPGWARVFRSPPWGVYRRSGDADCPFG